MKAGAPVSSALPAPAPAPESAPTAAGVHAPSAIAAGTALTEAPSIRSAGCIYSVATRSDEPALRTLLRTNALGGWVRLAFQREPDAYAATFGLAHSHDFIIAYEERSGRPVGLCERFVRDAFVNGEIARLPYLGSLRVNADFRNRIRILRNGFLAVRDMLGDPRDLPFSLTSITADNDVARRVLCAGISGFPQYVPVGEMSTFAIRARRALHDSRVELARRSDLAAIAAFLQHVYRDYQFAPVWRAADLEQLPGTSWLMIRRSDRIVACLALWDQSSVKQTVISGYSRAVALTRPLFNSVAPLLRAPSLPPAGAMLEQVYLSHLAVTAENEEDFAVLLRAALCVAAERGYEIAVLGLSNRNALAATVRRHWKTREYRSLLHLVQWPERGACAEIDSDRTAHPEIALM